MARNEIFVKRAEPKATETYNQTELFSSWGGGARVLNFQRILRIFAVAVVSRIFFDIVQQLLKKPQSPPSLVFVFLITSHCDYFGFYDFSDFFYDCQDQESCQISSRVLNSLLIFCVLAVLRLFLKEI